MRPSIHLTAPYGWVNDPNGLVYTDGKYHFYYQHNPTGLKWGNIHWGHAESSDMLHFDHTGDVLAPDELGMMYSGSAVVDKDGRAGYGEDEILYFYTAAAKDRSVQCIAHSDTGDSLIKDGVIIPTIVGENRDPKVFYHATSDAFIMVLYLTKFDFAIFRSHDCKHWEKTQELSFDGMRECPDLFKLGKHWVFWSAQGHYLLGDFDGYTFTPKTERLCAYATPSVPYAAQTFSGLDKTVSVGWFNVRYENEDWTGMLTLPHELDIVETPEGPRLAFKNIAALDAFKVTMTDGKTVTNDTPFVIELDVPEGCKTASANILGHNFDIPVNYHKASKLSIAVDHGVIEILAKDGIYYSVLPFKSESLAGEAVLELS